MNEPPRRRILHERSVVATLAGGAALTGLGMAFHVLPLGGLWTSIGTWVSVLGLVVLAASLELAAPLRELRTMRGKSTGGTQYDRLKRWRRFKSTCISLNLLTFIGNIVLVAAVAGRLELLDVAAIPLPIAPVLAAHALVMAATMAFAFWLSLRLSHDRVPSPVSNAFFQLLVAGTLLLAAFAAVAARVPFQVPGLIRLTTTDTTVLLLGALTFASMSLFVSRGLPTIYAVFLGERDYVQRHQPSGYKPILLSASMAFALLFGVLILAFVFQLGLVRLLSEVHRNTVFLVLLGFVVLAVGSSVAVARLLANHADEARLYRPPRDAEQRRQTLILAASGVVTGILLLLMLPLKMGLDLPFFNLQSRNWIDLLTFAVLTACGPYGFYYARRRRHIRILEARFPDFLRDLAASRKAGLTLPSAVALAARGEYGELTPDIRKMGDQLALNVSFEEALRRFGERVRTPLIQRAVVLVNEAGRTGGLVADVLEAAAIDAREIKTLENERHATMTLYTIIIYVIFGVFLLVAGIMYGTFVPHLLAAGDAAIAAGTAQIGSIVFQNLSAESYRVFYYMAALVQGIGNGLIAGLIETGRGMAGLRHSFIMVSITWLTFALFLP